MEESYDEDGNVIVPFGEGVEGGEGGGGAKKTPAKKARRDDEEGEDDDDDDAADDDDDDDEAEDDEAAAADPPEEVLGSKRLRGAGGRPQPTLADKAAQAALRVAHTMSAEVAANKAATKAAGEMQKFKDAHPGPVAELLASVRQIVAQQNWTHAQAITFLNNASRGFAVSFRPVYLHTRACAHPPPHTPLHTDMGRGQARTD